MKWGKKFIKMYLAIIKILSAPNVLIIAIETPTSFLSASNIFDAPAMADDPQTPFPIPK